MSNVTTLDIVTTAPDTPENILEKAKAWGMGHCIVIGEDEKGSLKFGASVSDMAYIVWLLERAMWFMQAQAKDLP